MRVKRTYPPKVSKPTKHAAGDPTGPPVRRSRRRAVAATMLNFLYETFRLGLKNLRLHKLRSLLTALGIIIGVLAVIVMVAIGEGAKQSAMEQLQQLGA